VADVIVRRLDSPASGRVLDAHASFGRAGGEAPIVHGFVARSEVMQQVCRQITRLAPWTRGTLISGEVGTGKSLAMVAAQRLGPGRHAPVFTVDGGDETPAALARLGEVGRGSREAVTCLVPEISDLSPELQRTLAASFASSDRLPIGEGVHLIAATSMNPVDLVGQGSLRSDLFYQVTAVRYHLPSLADRGDDFPDLAATVLRDVCRRQGRDAPTVAAAALAVLQQRAWPGNVCELRNVLGRAASLAERGVIGVQVVRDACAMDAPWPRAAHTSTEARALEAEERRRLMAALAAAGGNKSVAAERLGLSRRSFYRRLERLDASVLDPSRPT
jgi:DNA-binding NtrC family response regulator